MPQPLPPVNPFDAITQSDSHGAYISCRKYEAAAIDPGSNAPKAGSYDALVLARVCGYMLIYAPTITALTNFTNEVKDAHALGLETLADLGLFYIDMFIRIFKRAKGPTPAPSDHPSRQSLDVSRENIMYLLEEAPKNHSNAKRLALMRDNYRCVITRRLDMVTENSDHAGHGEYVAATSADPYFIPFSTQCAHIVPDSLNTNISGKNDGGRKHQWAGGVWAVLERFGLDIGWKKLLGKGIHRIENVVTLETAVHVLFDDLKLWLVATGVKNQYMVHTTVGKGWSRYNPITLPSNNDIPPPDPEALKLHAICCQVAHLSGAGERIDEIHRDMEATCVLANDGSSVDLLNYELSKLVAVY